MSFTPLAHHVIFTAKRSTNLAEKTLADGKSVKQARRQKVDQMVKIYISQQKTNKIIL
jgi:hypothetical protein